MQIGPIYRFIVHIAFLRNCHALYLYLCFILVVFYIAFLLCIIVTK